MPVDQKTHGLARMHSVPDDMGSYYLATKTLADTSFDELVRSMLGRRATMFKKELCETTIEAAQAFGWGDEVAGPKPSAAQVFARGTRYLAAPVSGCSPFGWLMFAPKQMLEVWTAQRVLNVKKPKETAELWRLAQAKLYELSSFAERNKKMSELTSLGLMGYDPDERLWIVRSESGVKLLLLHVSFDFGDKGEKWTQETGIAEDFTALWRIQAGDPEVLEPIEVGQSPVGFKGFDLYAGVSHKGGPPALAFEADYTLGALIPNETGYELDERLLLFPAVLTAPTSPSVRGLRPPKPRRPESR